MASRAAIAAAARRQFQPLDNGGRASKCFLRDREAEYLAERISGAPPISLQQNLASKKDMKRNLPEDYVAPAPYVFETRLLDRIYYERSRPLIAEPKPGIFIRYLDKDDREYFTAHSVNEDGSVTPKYYIYAPRLIKEKGYEFSDTSCNGIFHFLNGKGDHLLWSPTADKLETLPKSFDMLPGVTQKLEMEYGMWCDHRCEDFKLMQVVGDSTEERGVPEIVYHIELYSLKRNSWKIFKCREVYGIQGGVCINGAFYVPAMSAMSDKEKAHVIFSFDFSTETLSTLPLPEKDMFFRSVHSIFDYNGMVSVLVYPCNETVPSFYDYGLWTRTDRG